MALDSFQHLLQKLNPQQVEAVTTIDGPVLVLAGPGSGKTRVLTHRIAYLVSQAGVRPHNILAVTFTNKAAGEMRARVETILGGRLDGLQIGTFHSICARLLRIEAGMGALPYGRDYAIYDTDDQLSLVKATLAELNVDTKKFQPGRVLGAISQAKNELITPEEYSSLLSRDYFTEVVGRVYPSYQKKLINSNAMDFDDLLMQTVLLLRNYPDVRDKYQTRYEYVLVDEFQDTNTAQYQLVKLLALPQNNVFVVGDEDQGIYAFRGADYRNVMQFRRDYADARVILLEQNYRSTQVVLDAARAIIDKNAQRTPKALFTDREGGAKVTVHEAYTESEEGEYIVQKILELRKARKYAFRDFAIMFRTNAQSRALEDAAVKWRIPYRLVGGVGFYKRREVKDILAYLRLINNPSDQVSFQRIVNAPGRGVGEKSVATFLSWAANIGGIGAALEATADGANLPISGRANNGLREFARLVRELRALSEGGNLLVVYDELIAQTGYTLYLNEISDTPEQVTERQENLNELRGLVNERKDLSLTDFLGEVSLVAEVDALDETTDSVTLLTMHAAKGLEYSVVFIAGMEDGLLPHSRSLNEPDAMAEERRLLYVGLTRAKDELFLTYAFRRSLYGDSSIGIPSRFLADIPPDLTQGAATRIRQERERYGYERETSWDRGDDSFANRNNGARGRESDGGRSARIYSFEAAYNNAKREAPAAPQLKYRTGMKVYHPKFGEGIVINSKKAGGDEEVEVRFDQYGFKVLAASFANLTVLS